MTINFIPRIKIYFFLKNIQFFFFFFLKNFLFFFLKNFLFFNYFKYAFLLTFFFKQINRFLKKINLKLFSFFDNRLTKSYFYWIFRTLCLNVKNYFNLNYTNFQMSKFFCFNTWSLSIKFLNTNFFNLFFKNFFFYLLTINTFYYIPNNFFVQFQSSFLLLNPNTSVYSFYGGYFFNIYSI